MADAPDYWKDATLADWHAHVVQSLEASCSLIEDWDQTFLEATEVLSDAYVSLHAQRATERPAPANEHELEDLFWALQRSSTVIDSVVGSACVVLMRWMDQVKWIAIGAFDLLATKFPPEAESEDKQAKWNRLHGLVMRAFGPRVRESDLTCALAIWQIGNVFKHGGGRRLHDGTIKVARELGFSSQLLDIAEHDGEEELRQLALREVAYTLDADSIERMALQLDCGPGPGLMPLYGHVDSWRKAIEERLRDEQHALRG